MARVLTNQGWGTLDDSAVKLNYVGVLQLSLLFEFLVSVSPASTLITFLIETIAI